MDIEYLEARSRCAYNLSHIRQLRGYSIEALAVLSGVPEDEIRNIEDGLDDFDIMVLANIACQLNVDFRCILIDLDFRPPSQ